GVAGAGALAVAVAAHEGRAAHHCARQAGAGAVAHAGRHVYARAAARLRADGARDVLRAAPPAVALPAWPARRGRGLLAHVVRIVAALAHGHALAGVAGLVAAGAGVRAGDLAAGAVGAVPRQALARGGAGGAERFAPAHPGHAGLAVALI